MDQPPPLPSAAPSADASHLRLLSIFHFVMAGLSLFGIAFLALHYVLMSTVFTNPKLFAGPQAATPPPQEIFAIMRWFYVVCGVAIVAYGIGNLLSGFFLRARKAYIFSMVIAGLNCLHMPLGTVLGVFTIIVLIRDSVRQLYGKA